jgi:hypothetical protein
MAHRWLRTACPTGRRRGPRIQIAHRRAPLRIDDGKAEAQPLAVTDDGGLDGDGIRRRSGGVHDGDFATRVELQGREALHRAVGDRQPDVVGRIERVRIVDSALEKRTGASLNSGSELVPAVRSMTASTVVACPVASSSRFS